jgi:hypothetical protein
LDDPPEIGLLGDDLCDKGLTSVGSMVAGNSGGGSSGKSIVVGGGEGGGMDGSCREEVFEQLVGKFKKNVDIPDI